MHGLGRKNQESGEMIFLSNEVANDRARPFCGSAPVAVVARGGRWVLALARGIRWEDNDGQAQPVLAL